MGDGVAFATGSFGVWEDGLGRLLTPICGLSLPLRRMVYASQNTFIGHRHIDHRFYLRLRRRGWI